MDGEKSEGLRAPALRKRNAFALALHTGARLWKRLLDRDFIRWRAARIRPAPGSSLPAYSIAYNEHGGYCVPLGGAHRPCARAIMAGRVWERATLDLIAGAIRQGDVVHAGAFFGDFLPPLAKRLAPGAKLWTFEPNTMNYKAARLTLAINEIDNVDLMNAGLGAKSADAHLAVEDRRGVALAGSSFVADAPPDGFGAEAIRLVALDDVIPEDRSIDVIHLDVEGYEEAALTGAMRLIERSRPFLVLETAPDGDWFDRMLRPFGYEAAGRVDENIVFRTRT